MLSNDKIKTIKPNDNHRPTAIAGIDRVVKGGQTVVLDGSNSSDVDGDKLSLKLVPDFSKGL